MNLAGLFRSKPRAGRRGFGRAEVAAAYLAGSGIEIGALQFPLELPPGARATYVDRMSVAELRKHYPELGEAKLTEPDVIDDGERLGKFADRSQDFVVANHFLEHCQNPIGALANFARVLKPGGALYMAVPDMRFTFDRGRAPTPLAHVLRDWREGPEGSRQGHYEEWVRVVHKVEDPAWADNRIRHFMETDYSIHFHAWSAATLLELLLALPGEPRVPLRLELFLQNGEECLAVLLKEPAPEPGK